MLGQEIKTATSKKTSRGGVAVTCTVAIALVFSAMAVSPATAEKGEPNDQTELPRELVALAPAEYDLSHHHLQITEEQYLARLPDKCQEDALDRNRGGRFITPEVHGIPGVPEYWEPGFAGNMDRIGGTPLVGTAGDDIIIGSTGRDEIRVGAPSDNGNDVVCSGPGADLVYGDEGRDTIFVGDNHPGVTEYNEPSTGEWVRYGWMADMADRAYGAGGDDHFFAEERAVLRGEDGDDTFFGGASDAAMFGGKGDDEFNAGSGAAKMYGDNGVDTFVGSPQDDVMYGGRGDDTMNGGGGNDFMVGNEGEDTMHGEAGLDILWGKAGADHLFGDRDNDLLCGGTGNDHMDGGSSFDIGADRPFFSTTAIENLIKARKPSIGICTDLRKARAFLALP